jgi:hypothetical protein
MKMDMRSLATRVQYAIVLAVMIPIAAFAWVVGRDDPVPDWINAFLIPALGWLGLILIAIVIADWIRTRMGRN